MSIIRTNTRNFLLLSGTLRGRHGIIIANRTLSRMCITHETKYIAGTQRAFDMALSILKMGPVLFGSTEDLISFLQGKGLLATNKQCPNCLSTMDLQRRSDIEDKFRLY